MSYVQRCMVAVATIGAFFATAGVSLAVSLNFAGTQTNLGSTFYPGTGEPPCCVVPWRSDSGANTFAVSDQVPNRYYGTAGYAMFATLFTYPNQNLGYSSSVSDPIFADNDLYIDLIDLPDFVTNSQILSTRKAAGWGYAIIDDPVLQHGYRQWTFDGVNYPNAQGPCPGPDCNVNGGIPYVKLGLLDGNDILGNNPGTSPSGRWGFEVGENAPAKFRVGVMTDGLDATIFAAGEVFLTHAVNNVPDVTISSGTLVRDRFVDMHFFDITGAQAGDQFIFSAKKGAGDPGYANAGISGFTFDILPDAAGTPGDYNNDGTVNAADYTVWRDHLNTGFALVNRDPTNSGDVNEQDYAFWKSQFGLGGGAGAVNATGASVPEPMTAWLIFTASAIFFMVRRGRVAAATSQR